MALIQIILIILSVIFSVIIAISGLTGFFKGWKRSLFGLCRTVLAVIVSFVVIRLLVLFNSPMQFSPTRALEDLIDLPISYDNITSLTEVMLSVINSVLMPFVFVVIFIITDLLLRIPAYFIGKAMGIYGAKSQPSAEICAVNFQNDGNEIPDQNSVAPKVSPKKSKKHAIYGKLGGSAINAVKSLLVILLCLMPITGLLFTFTDGFTGIVNSARNLESGIVIGNDIEIIDRNISDGEGMLDISAADRLTAAYITPVRSNFYLSLSYSAPMRMLYTGMTGSGTFSNGFRNEIMQAFDLAADAVCLLAPPEYYGEIQKTAVNDLIGSVSDSERNCRIAADILSETFSEFTNDDNINDSDATSGITSTVTTPLFRILSESTAESIRADLETVRDLICSAIDYKIPVHLANSLISGDALPLATAISDEEYLYEFISTTYENPDFRKMNAAILNFIFSILVNEFYEDEMIVEFAHTVDGVSDAELRNEAHSLSLIIKDMLTVVETIPDLQQTTESLPIVASMDMEAFNRCIDNASQSIFIGDGIRGVVILILRSDTFDNMRGMADILVHHLENDPDVDLVNLLDSTRHFTDILSAGNTDDNNGVPYDADTLRKFDEALDRKNAEILREMINASSFSEIAPGKSPDSDSDSDSNTHVQKFLSAFVSEMESSELSDEDYLKEAKALDRSMQILNASADDSSSLPINTDEEIREFIDTMAESSVVSNSVVALTYDENGEFIPDALNLAEKASEQTKSDLIRHCEECYKEKSSADPNFDCDGLAATFTSIASLFGEDISDDIDQWNSDLQASR